MARCGVSMGGERMRVCGAGNDGVRAAGSGQGACAGVRRALAALLVMLCVNARPGEAADAGTDAAARQAHQVQLGDFGGVLTAEVLRDELQAAGYPARLQRRVAVGPLESRQQAHALRERLAQRQGLAGVVVAQGMQGGYLVQVGVFRDADNAATLLQRLLADGWAAQLHGRVTMGPYASHAAAAAALQQVRAERGLDGALLALPGPARGD